MVSTPKKFKLTRALPVWLGGKDYLLLLHALSKEKKITIRTKPTQQWSSKPETQLPNFFGLN